MLIVIFDLFESECNITITNNEIVKFKPKSFSREKLIL